MSVTWGHSILDWRSHAVDDRRDHPAGVFQAECGHRLMTSTTLHDEPHGPPCEACAAGQLALAVTRRQGDTIPRLAAGRARPRQVRLPAAGRSHWEPTRGDRHGR